jgi:hypothetical protein
MVPKEKSQARYFNEREYRSMISGRAGRIKEGKCQRKRVKEER